MSALFCAPLVQAADHLDGPAIAMAANAMADINDVFAWMTADGASVNLAMTISPNDNTSRRFAPSVQYVFHVEQHPVYGMAGDEKKIICTFLNDASGQCWLVDKDGNTVDYVNGDLSNTVGKESNVGLFKVFAGRRSDPFFFNLSGFREAAKTVKATTLSYKPTGCPDVASGAVPAALRTQLQAVPDSTTDNGPCAEGERDCFLPFNVKAIVIQIDKTAIVDTDKKLVSVWASTHAVQ